MLLACDIGNSNIKAGLFIENDILESFQFQDVEKVKLLYSERNISYTGISSVVPAKSNQLKEFLDSKSLPYYQITKKSKFSFKLLYKTPDTLGIDRICSAEGAYFLNGQMNINDIIISLDFGTATTINVILYPGEFIGGVIAPGVHLMSDSLHSNTAQLPIVETEDFHNMIGITTKESIASGLFNSTVGMIERILNHLQYEYKTGNMKIFLTGGNAEKIAPHIKYDFVFEKNLVLYGIKNIISLNTEFFS
jgi:type III pantothenate kinase